MKLGFKLRNIKIKIEKKMRNTLLIFDYLIWYLFSSKTKKPKQITNVLIIDLTKAWGDVLNTFLVSNKIIKKYPDTNFWFLLWDDFSKAAEKGYNLKTIPFEHLNYVHFDMAIVIWMSDKKLKEIPIGYKVGVESGGVSDIFKYFNLSKMMFPRYTHKIRQKFEIFKLAGFEPDDEWLNLPYSEYYAKEAEKLIFKLNLKETDKITFINPQAGTSDTARELGKYPSHDWDKWGELIDKLSGKIIITGTKEIIKSEKAISICGKISFFGLGELLRKFKDNSCIISLDTATPHLAASVGMKAIDLMGPYDPKLYNLWQGVTLHSPKPCSNCRKYFCPEEDNICMKNINVEEVINATKI